MIFGQDKAIDSFLRAKSSGALHHAWLLAGPRGVGKASFACLAASRLLAEAAGPPPEGKGLEIEADHPIARLVEAGSHPDFRMLERLENKTGTALARSITVDQVRQLGELFAVTPALSSRRAVVIDSVDDLESSAANALLKMLEEPPSDSIFLLVSHVPGRLLPTIRSRCRKLDFQPLGDDAMASALAQALPDQAIAERESLIAAAGGSPGRAVAMAGLDLEPIRQDALSIMETGDPTNATRSTLAQLLGGKGSAERYAAFLDLAPSLVASEARRAQGRRRLRLLDAYGAARRLARIAPRLSYDPAATAFQMGTILASVAPGERHG